MSGRGNRFSRRAGRRGGGKDKLGIVLIALALSALASMAVAGVMLRAPPTDPDTLCRTDAPVQAHTYILVDATDRLEPRHRRKLRAVVQQERQRLRPYDRLTIASLRADRPQEPRLLFSLCNPGDGRDANPLFQNTRHAQERWEQAFGAELDSAVRRASGGRGGAASPIAAGLRAVAADPDFGAEIPARRLVLISDLLEHEREGFSLYAANADFARYRATGAAIPDLDNVAVRVAPLDRPDDAARQAAARGEFWPAYFSEAGAQRVEFDPQP
ncbi:MAG: hypothetical protein AB7J28_14670 [Hyphomonadaceae bacterium]